MVAYISGEELRLELGLDAKYAAATQRAADAISELVDNLTGTTFKSQTAAAHLFDARQRHQLRLPWFTSVSALAVDLDGDGEFETTIAASDYYLKPYNDTAKNLIVIRPRSGKYFPTAVCPGVQVTAVWGWSTLPPATIIEAVFVGARRIFKRKDAIFGVQGAADLGVLAAQIDSLRHDPDFTQLVASGPWNRAYAGAL